jgi:hypothetical protein
MRSFLEDRAASKNPKGIEALPQSLRERVALAFAMASPMAMSPCG